MTLCPAIGRRAVAFILFFFNSFAYAEVVISLDQTALAEAQTTAVRIGNLSVSGIGGNPILAVSNSTVWEIQSNRTLYRKTGNPVDFDTLPVNNKFITVTISTADLLNTPYTQDFHIAVTNINEAATLIQLNPSTIPENSPGVFIGTLQANDPDAGQLLRYSITPTGGLFVLKNNHEIYLSPSTSFNFENPPTGLQFTATVEDDNRPPLGTSTLITLQVGDLNDPTRVTTWIPNNPLTIGQAETPTAIASRAFEAFSDEDTAAPFRLYDTRHFRVAVTLPNGSFADQFVVLDAQGVPVSAGTTSVVIHSRTFTFTRDTVSAVRYIDFVTPATGTTIEDLTELLLRIAYQPDPIGLSQRTDLSLTLSLEGNPSQARKLILNQVNAAPRLATVVPLTVKRFSHSEITPALLGLEDDHPELGLTVTVDYPPANGDLLTGSPGRILKANETVAIGWSGSPAASVLDLRYVPRTSSAEESDACFVSVHDHGARVGASPTSYRSSGFAKLAITITQPTVPSISPLTLGGTWNEAQIATLWLAPPTALLRIAESVDPASAHLGIWDLFVAYGDLHPAQGPASASEVLTLTPPLNSPLIRDGSSVYVAGSGDTRRVIATIDATLTGNGQALLLHLAPDATGADALLLGKALAYRDGSIRIPVNSHSRDVFVGFVKKGSDLGPAIASDSASDSRQISNTKVTFIRTGLDNPPNFVPTETITVATSTREPIHGSSVLIDPDTAATTTLRLYDSNGLQLAGQPPGETTSIDSPAGYSLAIPWTLPSTQTPHLPRSFTLTVTLGSRSVSQLISVVPLVTPDGSFAIVSDAPLVLFTTPPGSVPLRRQIRLNRHGATLDLALHPVTFYLIGNIPNGLSIDTAGASLVYNMAIMPHGIYRFSLLATVGSGEQLASFEQPVVLRVLADSTAN